MDGPRKRAERMLEPHRTEHLDLISRATAEAAGMVHRLGDDALLALTLICAALENENTGALFDLVWAEVGNRRGDAGVTAIDEALRLASID